MIGADGAREARDSVLSAWLDDDDSLRRQDLNRRYKTSKKITTTKKTKQQH